MNKGPSQAYSASYRNMQGLILHNRSKTTVFTKPVVYTYTGCFLFPDNGIQSIQRYFRVCFCFGTIIDRVMHNTTPASVVSLVAQVFVYLHVYGKWTEEDDSISVHLETTYRNKKAVTSNQKVMEINYTTRGTNNKISNT